MRRIKSSEEEDVEDYTDNMEQPRFIAPTRHTTVPTPNNMVMTDNRTLFSDDAMSR